MSPTIVTGMKNAATAPRNLVNSEKSFARSHGIWTVKNDDDGSCTLRSNASGQVLECHNLGLQVNIGDAETMLSNDSHSAVVDKIDGVAFLAVDWS